MHPGLPEKLQFYTANILTVLSTAFGSVTYATVIWLCISQPKIAIDLKLYSLVSLNVMFTVVAYNNHCQITVAHVTQPMAVSICNVSLTILSEHSNNFH